MAAERRSGSLAVRSRSSHQARRVHDSRPAGPAALDGVGDVRVREMQRSRLLTAAVGALGQFGWEGTSVDRITQRAGVSRRTFYELFENREECFLAVLQGAVAQITAEIGAAELQGLSWRERVRGGMWVVLRFFDREPALARVCIVESRRGGPVVLAYRQRVFDRLVEIVDEGRGERSAASDVGALTTEGVVGGVGEILHSWLSKQRPGALRDLLGQLMCMIVLPYLGVTAARRERTRPVPSDSVDLPDRGTMVPEDQSDPLAELPMRLTYRTARVLQALAEHPGRSNRQVAELVGIADQGQISKLLARLARLGLLVNDGVVKGERNQWTLTPAGIQVTRSIKYHALSTHTSH